MEKIYIVSHYYDNGESYEDFRDYEGHLYYSNLEQATRKYWESVSCNEYEGRYTLKEITLDTQVTKILERSEYKKCSSQFDDWYMQDLEEQEYENYAGDIELEKLENINIHTVDYLHNYVNMYENSLIESWLTHKGELYYESIEQL